MLKKTLFILLCVTCVSVVLAGVEITIEVDESPGIESGTSTGRMLIDGDKLSMVMDDTGFFKPEMIFRGDRNELWIIDHDRREYIAMDQEKLAALGQQLKSAMQMMEQQLAQMPAAQRAQIEEMMKAQMPGLGETKSPAKVVKTDERQTLEDYPCVKYESLVEGAKIREYWVTEWSRIEGSDEVSKVLGELGQFMNALLESMGDSIPFMGDMASNPFNEMIELDGFPIVTREFKEGQLGTESKMRSVKTKSIDPGVFEIPQGFKEQRLEMPGPK